MAKSAAQALAVLTHDAVFTAPIESLSVAEQAAAYATVQTTEEVAKYRRENLRESLLKAAETNGIPNEKGGYKLIVEGHTVLQERRTSSSPDEKKLMSLINKKGIEVEEVFDKVTILTPNASKIAALVDSGHITEEEGKALYNTSVALKVHPSREVEALLENSVSAEATPVKKTTTYRR